MERIDKKKLSDEHVVCIDTLEKYLDSKMYTLTLRLGLLADTIQTLSQTVTGLRIDINNLKTELSSIRGAYNYAKNNDKTKCGVDNVSRHE
jgi:uncharacterized coiled-coil protein SlyX